MLLSTTYQSPIGNFTLVSENGKLIGAWLEGQKYFLWGIKAPLTKSKNEPILMQAIDRLDRYFKGEQPSLTEITLAPIGSPFRQQVWKLLCEIPYGHTRTYGELARKIAEQNWQKSMSAQAIWGAVGHNPLTIFIPCHRVLGNDWNLTGYAGGIDKKITLLKHEKVDTTKFFTPKK